MPTYSTASIQMERDDILAGRENQHGSRRRSGDSIKHSRESETVDDPSSGLHRRANLTSLCFCYVRGGTDTSKFPNPA